MLGAAAVQRGDFVFCKRCFPGYKLDKWFLSCSIIDLDDPIHIQSCSTSPNCKEGGINHNCTLLGTARRTDCHTCSSLTAMNMYDTSKCSFSW